MPTPSEIWGNPTNIVWLERLWASGLSTQKIADVMGITKNSVVGKAHRLNLPSRPSPVIRDGLGRKKRVRRVRNPKTTLPEIAAPVQHPLPAVKFTPPPKPIAEKIVLTSKPCVFPLWAHNERPTHEYCGERGIPGKPYCVAHAAIAFHRPQADKAA